MRKRTQDEARRARDRIMPLGANTDRQAAGREPPNPEIRSQGLELKTEDNETVILLVKVVPGSSKTAIAGLLGGMLKIKVAAAPEKGKANECLAEFLAKTLAVRRNAVTIQRGQTSPVKQVSIAGISVRDLLDRLGI